MIKDAINNDAWAIMPSSLDNISSKVLAGVNDPVLSDEIVEGADGASYVEAKAAFMAQFEEQLRVDDNGTGYISIDGPMMLNPGPYERMMLGAADMGRISELVRIAAVEEEINGLVIQINSPGGTVVGTPELAGAIRDFNDSGKKSIAFTNSLMASAAYWVGSQCSQVVCTESAIVGSVGVIRAHVDLTEARAQAGVKVEVFRGGDNKVAGAYSTEISDEQRELIQEGIDEKHMEFQQVVLSYRDIDKKMLDGRTFYGKQAAENGFADAVVTSLASVAAMSKYDDYMTESEELSEGEVDNSRKDMSNPAENNNESAPVAEIAEGEVAISEAVATEQAEEFVSLETTADDSAEEIAAETAEEVVEEEVAEESEEVVEEPVEAADEEEKEESDEKEEEAEEVEAEESEEKEESDKESDEESDEEKEESDEEKEESEEKEEEVEEEEKEEAEEASLESRVDDLASKLDALIAALNPVEEKAEEESAEEDSEEKEEEVEEAAEEAAEEPSFEERVEEAAEAKAAKIAADSGVDSIEVVAEEGDSSKYANFTDAELWVEHSRIRNEEGDSAARAFYVSQIRSK